MVASRSMESGCQFRWAFLLRFARPWQHRVVLEAEESPGCALRPVPQISAAKGIFHTRPERLFGGVGIGTAHIHNLSAESIRQCQHLRHIFPLFFFGLAKRDAQRELVAAHEVGNFSFADSVPSASILALLVTCCLAGKGSSCGVSTKLGYFRNVPRGGTGNKPKPAFPRKLFQKLVEGRDLRGPGSRATARGCNRCCKTDWFGSPIAADRIARQE